MSYARIAALAALALAAAHPAAARSGAPYRLACAGGYYADAGGNCQPEVAQVNRYCPVGTVFHPTFDGWTCDPPPPEAY